jgi:FAD/FMN-containing dehydrogenase
MDEQLFAKLKDNIAGKVILPTSPEYETARNSFNHSGSPAIVVRPANNDDVAVAIKFARGNQLKLAIRSGGHALSGLSTNVGGLVIDLVLLNKVEILDPRQALVRIGAGAKWGDVAAELNTHGLGVSSGDTNSVGVGGLTLGGGIGWLVRKYGLPARNLRAPGKSQSRLRS